MAGNPPPTEAVPLDERDSRKKPIVLTEVGPVDAVGKALTEGESDEDSKRSEPEDLTPEQQTRKSIEPQAKQAIDFANANINKLNDLGPLGAEIKRLLAKENPDAQDIADLKRAMARFDEYTTKDKDGKLVLSGKNLKGEGSVIEGSGGSMKEGVFNIIDKATYETLSADLLASADTYFHDPDRVKAIADAEELKIDWEKDADEDRIAAYMQAAEKMGLTVALYDENEQYKMRIWGPDYTKYQRFTQELGEHIRGYDKVDPSLKERAETFFNDNKYDVQEDIELTWGGATPEAAAAFINVAKEKGFGDAEVVFRNGEYYLHLIPKEEVKPAPDPSVKREKRTARPAARPEEEKELTAEDHLDNFYNYLDDGNLDAANRSLRLYGGIRGSKNSTYSDARDELRDARKRETERKEKAGRRAGSSIVSTLKNDPDVNHTKIQNALDEIYDLDDANESQKEEFVREIRNIDNEYREGEKKKKEKKKEAHLQATIELDVNDLLANPFSIDLRSLRDGYLRDQQNGLIPGDVDFDSLVLRPLQTRLQTTVIDKYSAGRLKNPETAKKELEDYMEQGFVDQRYVDRVMDEVYERQQKMLNDLLAREARGETVDLDDMKDELVKKQYQRRVRERVANSEGVQSVLAEAKKLILESKNSSLDLNDVNLPGYKELTDAEIVALDKQIIEYRTLIDDLKATDVADVQVGGQEIGIMTKEGREKKVKIDILNIEKIVSRLGLTDEAQQNIIDELTAEQNARMAQVEKLAIEAEISMDKKRRAEFNRFLSYARHVPTAAALIFIPSAFAVMGVGAAGLAVGVPIGGLLAEAYNKYFGKGRIKEMTAKIKEEEEERAKAEVGIRRIISDSSLWARERAAAAYATQTGKDVNDVVKTYMSLFDINTVQQLRRQQGNFAMGQAAA